MADLSLPFFIQKRIIESFVKSYNISIDEFDADISRIRKFNDFFTRRFLHGVRQFSLGTSSPAEGYVAAYGDIFQGSLFQVKGNNYLFSELTRSMIEPLEEGSFITIYLSPADYHRVHAPVDLVVKKLVKISGTLYSTSSETLQNERGVYCKNERIVMECDEEGKKLIIVMVGAIAVGRIKMCDRLKMFNEGSESFQKGDELGFFELGSTVIMIRPDKSFSSLGFEENKRIILGEKICD